MATAAMQCSTERQPSIELNEWLLVMNHSKWVHLFKLKIDAHNNLLANCTKSWMKQLVLRLEEGTFGGLRVKLSVLDAILRFIVGSNCSQIEKYIGWHWPLIVLNWKRHASIHKCGNDFFFIFWCVCVCVFLFSGHAFTTHLFALTFSQAIFQDDNWKRLISLRNRLEHLAITWWVHSHQLSKVFHSVSCRMLPVCITLRTQFSSYFFSIVYIIFIYIYICLRQWQHVYFVSTLFVSFQCARFTLNNSIDYTYNSKVIIFIS